MQIKSTISEGYYTFSDSGKNRTLSSYVKKHRIKRNTLLNLLRDKNIIDENHLPYDEFEDWFEVRRNNPWTDKYFLSVTPIGEVELLKFAHKLNVEDGIDIFN